MPQNQLSALLRPAPAKDILDVLTAELMEEARLRKAGSMLQLPGHSATLPGPEASLWQRVRPILEASPTKPPVIHDLAKQVDLPAAAVEKLLGRCVQLGYLARPVKNRFFLPEGLDELESRLYELERRSKNGMFAAADYRDITGIGRNLAIELLEYFDRVGITQRMGDLRKIRHNSNCR